MKSLIRLVALACLIILAGMSSEVNALTISSERASFTSRLDASRLDATQQKVYLPPDQGRTGFVYKGKDSQGLKFCENKGGEACSTDAIATAVYKVGLNTRGWDELSLTTSASYTDLEQAYAAGYLEGAMTWERIHSFYLAWLKNKYRKEPARRAKIFDFVKKQDKFILSKVAEYKEQPATSPKVKYWQTVALIRQQLLGMRDGYNSQIVLRKGTPMRLDEIWLLNDDGDIFDIERLVNRQSSPVSRLSSTTPAFSFAETKGVLQTDVSAEAPLSRKRVSEMNRSELTEFIELSGRCTALIKRTESDLIVAHSTWSDYREMFRIYKHYNFNFAGTHSKAMSLSSYPGMIASSDDFYILGSGLVVTETTLTILNEALYKHSDPSKTIPAVVRSLVANLQATDAKSWTKLFSHYNSGTYNNQWMIVDMNKFTPSQPLLAGTFVLLEQIPGKIVTRDMSKHLDRKTYWGSYNRPYFKEVAKASMFQAYSKVHGEELTYRDAPRGQILARDHGRVKDAQSALDLLRENKYKSDPLAKGCSQNALASRLDLPSLPSCPTKLPRLRAYGAVDTKVTSFGMYKDRSALVVAGPTAEGTTPQFTWSKSSPSIARLRPPALPDTAVFEPTVIEPFATPKLGSATAGALLEADAGAEAEVEAETEVEADAEAEVEAEAEAEVDAEVDAEADLEMDLDAAEY